MFQASLRFVPRSLFVFGLLTGLQGCMFLEDFDKFVPGSKEEQDGGTDDAGDKDDGGNGGEDKDGSMPGGGSCDDVDCSAMDSDCGKGVCVKGKCEVEAVDSMDGDKCTTDKCTTDAVCSKGLCKGKAVDCSAMDSDCTKGVCDPADGSCGFDNVNEGDPCFDDDPCLVDEVCTAGECKGAAKDCKALSDACHTGSCNEISGACEEKPANLGALCDDLEPCTTGDACAADGRCLSTGNASNTTLCDDHDPCTTGDICDGTGSCAAAGSASNTTACDDGNECTVGDKCNGTGLCAAGTPGNEGLPCQTGCHTNDTCINGTCDYPVSSHIISTCEFFWCDYDPGSCLASYNGDGFCDCGCGFTDVDCSECSSWMCLAFDNHKGASWCDPKSGKAVDNCPESFKDNDVCDCGCQFVDPECDGGPCCGATGTPGCGNSFIEDCVSFHADFNFQMPECVNTAWTTDCAISAELLGCMTCPNGILTD